MVQIFVSYDLLQVLNFDLVDDHMAHGVSEILPLNDDFGLVALMRISFLVEGRF